MHPAILARPLAVPVAEAVVELIEPIVVTTRPRSACPEPPYRLTVD